MKKILFFILLLVGANCLPMTLLKDILTELKKSNYRLQTSVDHLRASVTENKNYINALHNQSSSNSEMLEINLDKMQKHLTESTEQTDQKLDSISKDLQKAALNTDKFQNSIDKVSASVAQNMKFINDLHNHCSSNSEMFESKFDEMQKKQEKTEQIIDQKFTSISEDQKTSTVNIKKLQDSVDQLSVNHNDTSSTVDQLSASVAEIKKYLKEEHNETSSFIKMLENKLNDSQETGKILNQKIVSISEGYEDAIQKLQQLEAEASAADCKDVFNLGKNVATSYLLPKYNRKVLCDMTTDGGGWLVIQKRQRLTQQVNFTRDWVSYKEGFGDLDTEFWIGNEFLHRITNQKSYELRIDLEDFEKGHFYATYSEFRVGNEDSGYQLHVGGFEGNVYDRLKFSNNMKFSTFDRDNDEWHGVNCAEKYAGGFWYQACYRAYLNGVFPTFPDRKNRKLIRWLHNGKWLNLINVEMKIRPKQ